MRKYRTQFSDRIMTGKVISRLAEKLIRDYDPTYICSEDAFYNPARPNAYISLLIAIYAIESKLFSMHTEGELSSESQAKLYKTPPTLIKKVVSKPLGGKANKLDMYDALRSLVQAKEISFRGKRKGICPPLEEFTEHSVDAICVGYAFTKIWLPLIGTKLIDRKCTSFSKQMRNNLKKAGYLSEYL